ncbi:MAG: hypothetical protein FJ006_13375 [Chloroflexi bacterium]|nr:hypothetical protein [Chloroflexota bacterium]MBM3150467.1 hypothetical protein [Chloroflexota bacterium]
MKKATKSQDAKKPSDVRTGIALAISFFAVSIFLYFQPQYFGALTTAIAVVLIVFGFAGLGFELNKITSEELDSLINREKGPEIFNNLGMGIACIIVWAALYHYFPVTWVNTLSSVILLFGVYGITLGLVNTLVFVLKKPSSKAALSQRESNKPLLSAATIIKVISSAIGIIASLIQILQFLKIIP